MERCSLSVRLIIPVQLLLEPLIGAIAAGNCAVLKPSELTPHVSSVICDLIEEIFEPWLCPHCSGGQGDRNLPHQRSVRLYLLHGSVPVGRIVMEAAAKNLVPVTLELGGKSPVIVDPTANLDAAAERIVWGKLMNAGQTCIAPDYILAHSSIKDELVEKLKAAMIRFYGSDASQSPDYGRIVNESQFDRLAEILNKDKERIAYGGASDRGSLYIEPTLLDSVAWSDAAMQEELFGPVLPILAYEQLDDAIDMINSRPKPLALYLFSENGMTQKTVLDESPSAEAVSMIRYPIVLIPSFPSEVLAPPALVLITEKTASTCSPIRRAS